MPPISSQALSGSSTVPSSIMVVAGEPSGDVHAAHVVREASQLQPGLTFFGMGGHHMADAGVELVYDIADSAVMGIAEVLASVPQFLRKMHFLRDLALERLPQAVLLVDFPDFNVRLAKQLRRHGLKIAYYIPPKAWAWRPWRAKQVGKLVSRVISILPFEADFYRSAGANVEFVGHPLLDFAQTGLTQSQARASLNQPEDVPIVALLPGSRRKELERLLPIMQETAARIQAIIPTVRFLLPLASSLSRDDLPDLPHVQVFDGQIYEILRAADVGIIASGTATLEAACLGTPMIILYIVSPSTWQIAKRMVRLEHSGLPNIIAGKEIVPEFLQDDVHPDQITPVALELLQDATARHSQQNRLAEVRSQLGERGAVRRTAHVLLEVAGFPQASPSA